MFLFLLLLTQICPLPAGEVLPDVNLKALDGKEISSHDMLAGKKSVIIVYRGGWCPFCNKHMAALRDILPEVEKRGAQLIAISPDSPETLSQRPDDSGPVLYSDQDLNLIKALGLAFKVDDQTIKKYEEYGIDLEAASGRDHHMLPVPAVIIVDEAGNIAFHYANPKYSTRLKPSLVLAALDGVADQLKL